MAPPLMSRVWPVMDIWESDRRNETNRAISCGVDILPSGTSFIAS